MIWLASFPRSGNTFIRNILYDVFGMESSTFDLEGGVLLEPGYLDYPVVKTHMLPSQLLPADPSVKAVYLVRDGRDAMVSIAHHRSDIIAPGSGFLSNMEAAIHAEKGSFFGGWSQNVMQWIGRADLIVRYEDLVADPVGCMEKIRKLAGLPEGDYARIPRFEALKYGIPKYGAGRDHRMTEGEKRSLAERNFRKGKAGSWREEMPTGLHNLFWSIHGEAMLKMGYQYDGSITPVNDCDFDWEVMGKLDPSAGKNQPRQDKIRVLIEAEKMASPVNDGVKRYQSLLLRELLHVHRNPAGRWHFDLLIHGNTAPVTQLESLILERFTPESDAKRESAGGLKVPRSVRIQQAILALIPFRWKEFLVRNNIMVLHKAFDLWWRTVHGFNHGVRQILKKSRRALLSLRELFAGPGKEIGGNPEGTYDLIHLPLQHHYRPFSRTGTPVIVTLHDFTHKIHPEFHTPQNTRNAERGWKFVLGKAKRAIAVSASCATDARRFGGSGTPPLDVIHEAVDRNRFHYRINSDDRRTTCRKYGIPENTPFLLTLSSIEPRKNLERVIQAFFEFVSKDTAMQVNLVVAGKQSWGTFHPHTMAGFDPRRVIFTGFVDDLDLPDLYSEALGFCYVSHYEGFGLPLLEALNCGTPVIYGNNSSMPEVAGDAGLAADASDYRDIAGQMSRLFYDETLRKTLREAALRQAARFSTRYMAVKTLAAYEKSLHHPEQMEI